MGGRGGVAAGGRRDTEEVLGEAAGPDPVPNPNLGEAGPKLPLGLQLWLWLGLGLGLEAGP